jgi:hypothetical protein
MENGMQDIPYFEKAIESLKPLNSRPMKTYRGEEKAQKILALLF